MQILFAALTYVATLAIVAAVVLVIVLTFAGPRADLLPATMQMVLFVGLSHGPRQKTLRSIDTP